MRLASLTARSFRNLEPLVFTPGPRFNVLAGDNGAGKSSVLEAVYYLGALRSFRPARAVDLIRTGEPQARLDAVVEGELSPRRVAVLLSTTEARKVALDGKRPRSSAAFMEAMPVVCFHPGDLSLASGPAELRRSYLDGILERIEPGYAALRAEYDSALRSRNRVLKHDGSDRKAITVYDTLLANRGARIGVVRRALASSLGPAIAAGFGGIVGEDLPFTVRYASKVEPVEAALRAALIEALPKDLARGTTSVGPHGDDLVVELRRSSARSHASQGQHRAISLAMKLSERSLLEERLGRAPLFLLDDVSSELDRTRSSRLFALIARTASQVFLTTTQPELIPLDHERLDFTVSEGRVAPRPR